jgi:hypothetical protein
MVLLFFWGETESHPVPRRVRLPLKEKSLKRSLGCARFELPEDLP